MIKASTADRLNKNRFLTPAIAAIALGAALAGTKLTIPSGTTSAEIARRLAEQVAPRKLAPFDPTHFDKYVGNCESGPAMGIKISRQREKFFMQLTGREPTEVYPQSETKFFATVMPAQISFAINRNGQTTELVLHLSGQETHFRKIGEMPPPR